MPHNSASISISVSDVSGLTPKAAGMKNDSYNINSFNALI